jgi:hypothetical protein
MCYSQLESTFFSWTNGALGRPSGLPADSGCRQSPFGSRLSRTCWPREPTSCPRARSVRGCVVVEYPRPLHTARTPARLRALAAAPMRHQHISDDAFIRRAGRTLSSRSDYALYSAAWLVFAAAFAAVFWLQQRPGSSIAVGPAAFAVLRIVLPAALLGIGVVRWCEQIGRRWASRPVVLLAHAAGALAFPSAWITAVNVTNNLISGAVLGRTPWRFPPDHVLHWHSFTGVSIYVALAGLTYGRAYVAESERRRLVAEARLLRGQLDPHFLFNTMHTVFALARLDATAGEDAVLRFSRLIRFALVVHRDDRDVVPLREEWAFTEDYLHLEALRLDGRVRWTGRLAENTLDCAVPPLLLQPLVENAVKHGGGRPNGVMIGVTAAREGPDLVIHVSDDGPGTTTDAALGSRGVGLHSVRARVAALTPRPGAVTIETAPGRGFVITLRLPAIHRLPSRAREARSVPLSGDTP